MSQASDHGAAGDRGGQQQSSPPEKDEDDEGDVVIMASPAAAAAAAEEAGSVLDEAPPYPPSLKGLPPGKEDEFRDRAAAIAKSLVQSSLIAKRRPMGEASGMTAAEQAKERRQNLAERRKRSAMSMGNPANARLYHLVQHERRVGQKIALRKALTRIQKSSELWSQRVKPEAFIREAMTELQACYVGCNCVLGLLQPQGDLIRYVVATPGSEMVGKTLKRGEGVSFRALDRGEPVCVMGRESELNTPLDPGSKPKQLASKGRGTDLPLVAVPLVADGCTIGVLSIDRFSNHKEVEGWEATAARREVVQRRQHDFGHLKGNEIRRYKLWRAPNGRIPDATVEEEPFPPFTASAAVAGRVVEIRPHPRWGPSYSVLWEDGLRESEINHSQMLRDVVSMDKERIGCGAFVDEDLLEITMHVGAAIARVLDHCRKTQCLYGLRDLTKTFSVDAEGVYRAGLDAVVANVLMNRVTEVWEVRKASDIAHEVEMVARIDPKGGFITKRARRNLEDLSKATKRTFFQRLLPPDAGSALLPPQPFTMPEAPDTIIAPFRDFGEPRPEREPRVVRVQLNEAQKLATGKKGIYGAGRTDPFVIFRFNGAEVKRTTAKSNTCFPKWAAGEEVAQVTLPEDPWACEMVIEVWDMVKGNAAGQFLGRVALHLEDLLFPGRGVRELDLQPRPDRMATDAGVVQGKLLLTIKAQKRRGSMEGRRGRRSKRKRGSGAAAGDESVTTADSSSSVVTDRKTITMLHLTVRAARGLHHQPNKGAVGSLLAIVMYDGVEVGRTKAAIQAPTTDPVWDQLFDIRIAEEVTASSEVRIEVRDAHDKKSSCIGYVVVPVGTFLSEGGGGEMVLDMLAKTGDQSCGDARGQIIVGYAITHEEEGEGSTGSLGMDEALAIEAHDTTLQQESVEARPQPVLKLRILEAKGLAKADFFGQSDPFCIVKWNDQEVGRTKVVPKTLDPVWSEERFDVPMAGDQVLSSLLVEVWDMDAMGVGDFLGKVVLRAEELHAEAGEQRHTYDLQPKDGAAADAGKVKRRFSLAGGGGVEVRGTLTMQFSIAITTVATAGGRRRSSAGMNARRKSVGQPSDPIRLSSFAPPREVLRLQVHKAVGLAKANFFGASDPFCIIKWCGKEVRRTAVIKKNLNPVWDNEAFNIPLPAGNEDAADHEMLTVEVWDMDTLAVGDFLGQVCITRSALGEGSGGADAAAFALGPMLGVDEKKKLIQGSLFLSFAVVNAEDVGREGSNTARSEPAKRGSVQAGKGVAAVSSPNAAVDEGGPRRVLTVQVHKVTSLAKHDLLGSRADAFVIVRWEGKEVGRTPLVNKCVEAEWEDQTFQVEVAREGRLVGVLMVQACDTTRTGFSVLAEAMLTDEDEILREPRGGRMALDMNLKGFRSPLSPSRRPQVTISCTMDDAEEDSDEDESDNDVEKKKSEVTKGASSTDAAPVVGSPRKHRRRMILEVEVHKATGLPRTDYFFGRPSPYCVLKCNGREFGRGRPVRKSLDPTFQDGAFRCDIPQEAVEEGRLELCIEVWSAAKQQQQPHEDEEDMGSFLGQVTIAADSLLLGHHHHGRQGEEGEKPTQLTYSLHDPYSHKPRPGNLYVSFRVSEEEGEEHAGKAGQHTHAAAAEASPHHGVAGTASITVPHSLVEEEVRLTSGIRRSSLSLPWLSPPAKAEPATALTPQGGRRRSSISSLFSGQWGSEAPKAVAAEEEPRKATYAVALDLHSVRGLRDVVAAEPIMCKMHWRGTEVACSRVSRGGGGGAPGGEVWEPSLFNLMLEVGGDADKSCLKIEVWDEKGGVLLATSSIPMGEILQGRKKDHATYPLSGGHVLSGALVCVSHSQHPIIATSGTTNETNRPSLEAETPQGNNGATAAASPSSPNLAGTSELPAAASEVSPPLLSEHLGVVRLKVLEAYGLGKADACGTSDPFGILKWDDVEVGRTKVLEKTLHPVWDDAHFVLPLIGDRDRSVLGVELWDMNDDGVGEFLGQVMIRVEDLLGDSNGTVTKRLVCKPGMDKKAQRLVQGSLVLCWDYSDEGDDDEEGHALKRIAEVRKAPSLTAEYLEGFQGKCTMLALTATRRPGYTWPADLSFCGKVAVELETALLCVRAREQRTKERQACIQEFAKLCNDWEHVPFKRILAAMRFALERCLPACDAYIAVLQKGGKVMSYVEATSHSRMTGNRLHLGEGVSFACVHTMQSLIIREAEVRDPPTPERMQPGDAVIIRYGTASYPGKITKWVGFDTYDVVYDGTWDKEAGVHASRLKWVPPPRAPVKKFESSGRLGWPYVCVPMQHGTSAVGVIGVDGFEGAARGRDDEEPPEGGVVEFLCEMGKLMGTALDLQRKTKGLRTIANVVRSSKASADDVYRCALDVMMEAILFFRKQEIWQEYRKQPETLALLRKDGDWEMDWGKRPRKEWVPTGAAEVLANVRRKETGKAVAVGGAINAAGDKRRRRRKSWGGGGNHHHHHQDDEDEEEEEDQEDYVYCREYPSMPSILVGRFKAWELKTVGADDEVSVPKIGWLVLYRELGVHWKEDADFLANVCQTMETALICVHGREFRGRARERLVAKLIKTCEEWVDLDCRRLLARVVEGLGKCFMGSDVYLGLILPGGEQIEFRQATRRSLMVGKRLSRGAGVGFDVVDGRRQVKVQSYSSPDAFRLRVFGETLMKCLPFVSTPILRGDRTVRGVINVDNIGKNDKDEHPEPSELDLLTRVANALGETIDKKAKQAALLELVRDVNAATVTVSDIYQAAIKALRQNIPLARVVERWCLPLHPIAQATSAAASMNQHPNRPQNVILDIHSAKGLAKADLFGKSDPFCVVKWNEEEIARTEVIWKTLDPRWEEHFEFKAEGERITSSLILEVWDVDAGGPGDFLGQVMLRGNELGESCCTRTDFELRPKPGQDPKTQTLVQGRICLSLELQDINDEKSEKEAAAAPSAAKVLQLQVHRAEGLARATFMRKSDPFVVVKWASKEVGRTKAVKKTLDPMWEGERFDVPMGGRMVVRRSSSGKPVGGVMVGGGSGGGDTITQDNQHLVLEVYRSEGDMVGQVVVKQADLDQGVIDAPKAFDIMPPAQVDARSGNKAKKSKDTVPVGRLFLRFKLKDPSASGDDGADDDLPAWTEGGAGNWPLVRIDIFKATGLAKADFFGKSDPFCVLSWNGQEVGQTKVVEKSLDPVWQDEHFEIPLTGGLDGGGGGLVVDVFDMNRSGRGLFLGQVVLTAKALKECGRKERQPTDYELQAAPKDTNEGAMRRRSSFAMSPTSSPVTVQGRLFLAYDLIQDPRKPPAPKGLLRLKAYQLAGLVSSSSMNANTNSAMNKLGKTLRGTTASSSSIPSLYFLILRYNGEEVARTSRAAAMVRGGDGQGETRSGTGEKVLIWGPGEGELEVVSEGGYHTNESEVTIELWEVLGGKNDRKEVCVASASIPEREFRGDENEDDEDGGTAKEESQVDARPPKGITLSATASFTGTVGGKALTHSMIAPVLTCSCSLVLRPEDDPMWVQDPELSLLQVHVLRASGLAKADLFGKSDPFCIIKWDGEEVGKTKVIDKTLDPVWDNEIFTIQMDNDPGPTPLCIEVWDMDAVGVGDFLGQAVLCRKDLKADSEGEVELELGPKAAVGAGDMKHVKGRLYVKYVKLSKKQKERFETIVRLQVLEAHGLAKADLLGQSDPFCIVKWNDQEVGRTKVITKTLDPVWGEEESFSVEQTGNAMEGELKVEVWDMDSSGPGDFLGQVVLKGKDLLTPTDGSAQFDLQPRPGASKAEVKFVRGYLSVTYVTMGLDGKPVERPRSPEDGPAVEALSKTDELALHVRILGCHGLTKSAVLANMSTYCVVKWNGKEVGRTTVVANTAQPTWDPTDTSAAFCFHVPADRLKMRLRVEVWTHGAVSGTPELLGSLTMMGDVIIHAPVGPRNYRLARADDDPKRYPSIESYVTLELVPDSKLWSDCARLLDATPCLILHIHDARGLAKADLFGNSDPFCIIKWGGKEVGRTKVVDNTLDPDWVDEKFELPIPDDPTSMELLVEVWDMDGLRVGDFLGQVTLSCGALLRMPLDRIEYDLKEREGGKKENKFVQGKLALSVRQKTFTRNAKLKYGIHPFTKSLEGKTRAEVGLTSIDLYTLFQSASRLGSSTCILYEQREMVLALFNDIRVRIGDDFIGPTEGCYRYALAACGPSQYSTFEDSMFARDVIRETQLGLRRLRGVHQRAAARKLALRRLQGVCERFHDYDDMDGFYSAMVECLEVPMLGCDIYLSLLVSGGQLLRCVSASAESGMMGKELRRGSGVSFECVGTGYKTFLLVHLPAPSAKKMMAATNAAALADSSSTMATTTASALVVGATSMRKPRPYKKSLFDRMKVLGNKSRASMPYLCVPLLRDRCTIGILGCDNFNQLGGTGCSNDDATNPHPEPGVIDWFKEAATIIGSGIEAKRRHDTVKELETVVDNPTVTPEDLYLQALRCALLNMAFAVKAQVWKLDEDWNLHVLASLAHTQEDALVGARMLRISKVSLDIFPQSGLHRRDCFIKVVCGGLERRSTLRSSNDLPVWDERFDFKIGTTVSTLTGELWAMAEDAGHPSTILGRADFEMGRIRENEPASIVAYLTPPLTAGPEGDEAAHAKADKHLTTTGVRAPVGRFTIQAMYQPIEMAAVNAGAAAAKVEAFSRKSIRLSILRANNLAKADLIGSSDPFVVVRWNEKEMGQTATVMRNLNPVWDSEVFNLNLPSEAHAASVTLVLEVWDQDAGVKGDFLGEVVVHGEDLLAYAASREPVAQPLGDKPIRTNKTIKGELVFRVEAREGAYVEGRVGQVDKKLKAKMMDLVSGVRQHLGVYSDKDVTRSTEFGPNAVLRLRVVDALNLSLKNVMVLIKVNGVEKARTSVIRDTYNPRWVGARPDENSCVLAFFPPPAGALQGLELCLEVWNVATPTGDNNADYLLPSPVAFLGQVVLRGERLHRMPKGDVEYDLERRKASASTGDVHVQGVLCINAAWVSLAPKDTRYDLGRKGVAAGSLSYMPLDGTNSLAKDKAILLRLDIFGAEDLPSADTFGSSDPYCIVKWRRKKSKTTRRSSGARAWDGGQGEEGEEHFEEEEMGRTKVIWNNLNPIYEDEVFHLRIREDEDMAAMALVVEVWDKDIVGPGDFLGSAVIAEGEDLLSTCPPQSTRPLYPKPSKKKAQQQPSSKGSVRFALARQDPSFTKEVLEVTVMAAHGLANADFMGKSDPYVVLHWNGAEAGRTRVMDDTLDPVWNETFMLHVPVSVGARATLRMEVWDMDLGGQGDFLGQVIITADELLQPTGNPELYRLEPKPGQHKKLKLVQGYLEVKWLHRCLGICHPPPERLPARPRRETYNLGVDVLMANDPIAEELRLKKDKLQLPNMMERTVALAELCDNVLGNPGYRKGMELESFEAGIEPPVPVVTDDDDDDDDDDDEVAGPGGALNDYTELPDPDSSMLTEISSGQMVMSVVRKIASTVLRGILYDRLVVTFNDEAATAGRKAGAGFALVVYCRAREIYPTDRAFGRLVAERLAEELGIIRRRQARADRRQQTLFRLSTLCSSRTTPSSWAAMVKPQMAIAARRDSASHASQETPLPAAFTADSLARAAIHLLSTALGPACTVSVYNLRRDSQHDPQRPGSGAFCFRLAGSTLFAAVTTEKQKGHAAEEPLAPPKPVIIRQGEAGSAHLFRCVEEGVMMLHLDRQLKVGHPSWSTISQAEMLVDKEGLDLGGDFIAVPLWDRDVAVGVIEITGVQSLAIEVIRPESSPSGSAALPQTGTQNTTSETALEEGVIGFLRDVGVMLGPAVSHLRRRTCLDGLHGLCVAKDRGKKVDVRSGADEEELVILVRQATVWLKEACPYAASVAVWQLTTDLDSLRDLAEEERQASEERRKVEEEERKKRKAEERLERRVAKAAKREERRKKRAEQALRKIQQANESAKRAAKEDGEQDGAKAQGEKEEEHEEKDDDEDDDDKDDIDDDEASDDDDVQEESSVTKADDDATKGSNTAGSKWSLKKILEAFRCVGPRMFAGGQAAEGSAGATIAEAELQPTALKIMTTARFGIRTTDRELSLSRGLFKLQGLEGLSSQSLALLGREWHRALMNVKAEYFWSSSGHLVALVRRRLVEEEQQYQQQATSQPLGPGVTASGQNGTEQNQEEQDRQRQPQEKETVDYAIVMSGWMDRIDLDLVVKAMRLLNEAVAIRERRWRSRLPTVMRDEGAGSAPQNF